MYGVQTNWYSDRKQIVLQSLPVNYSRQLLITKFIINLRFEYLFIYSFCLFTSSPVLCTGRAAGRAWNSEVQQRDEPGRASTLIDFTELLQFGLPKAHWIRQCQVQYRTGLSSNVPESIVRGPLPTGQLFPWQEKVRKSRTVWICNIHTISYFGCICASGLY